MTLTHLVSFVLLGIAAAHVIEIRHSPITLPIATHINVTGGTAALIKAERAKLAALRTQRLSPHVSIPVPALDGWIRYTCDVSIGSPPTSYSLIVDTGSSNTWVNATDGQKYAVTSTSHETTEFVGVQYGSGAFSGKEYTDTVRIGSADITAQSIGVATSSQGFEGVDGILGIGPVDLTVGTLYPDLNSSIPTVTDNLKAQGFTSSRMIGISFEPTTPGLPQNFPNGQLDFGGMDVTKYTPPISYVNITSTTPSSKYWGVTQGITYDGGRKILSRGTAGIVDTGTTLVYLASDAFERYVAATSAVLAPETGLLALTPAQLPRLKSLHFTIGKVTYEFTADAQVWPRHLNEAIGGKKDAVYLVITNTGAPSGQGLDFINGLVWLQRFYTAYDSDTGSIGFANTPNTRAKTNSGAP